MFSCVPHLQSPLCVVVDGMIHGPVELQGDFCACCRFVDSLGTITVPGWLAIFALVATWLGSIEVPSYD